MACFKLGQKSYRGSNTIYQGDLGPAMLPLVEVNLFSLQMKGFFWAVTVVLKASVERQWRAGIPKSHVHLETRPQPRTGCRFSGYRLNIAKKLLDPLLQPVHAEVQLFFMLPATHLLPCQGKVSQIMYSALTGACTVLLPTVSLDPRWYPSLLPFFFKAVTSVGWKNQQSSTIVIIYLGLQRQGCRCFSYCSTLWALEWEDTYIPR